VNVFYYSSHFDRHFCDGAGFRACSIFSLLNQKLNVSHIQRSSILCNNSACWPFFLKWYKPSFKTLYALIALITNQHYICAKHISFFTKFLIFLLNSFFVFDVYYIHFLWSFRSIKKHIKGKILVIDTHNYDPDWWDNLEASSKWPWEKLLCRISKQRILEILADLPKNTLLVHVSQEDADKYRTHRPDLTHLVLPNGCTMRPRSSAPAYPAPIKKIYFLGALNLQITRDAILHFDKTFWPQFSAFCEFHLIGSGPTAFWKPFCAERGWHLHNNVPDDDLTRLLEGMHYLVLPFTYGAGSKLKFIDACARGIPVISTPPGVCGFPKLPPTVRISENPSDWAKWISSSQGPTRAETSACLTFAKEYSWDKLVAKIWPQIQNHPPVP